jgi:hypothetical protein
MERANSQAAQPYSIKSAICGLWCPPIHDQSCLADARVLRIYVGSTEITRENFSDTL